MLKGKFSRKASPKKAVDRKGKMKLKKIKSLQPEHPLIAAFSNTVDQTSAEIKARVDVDLAMTRKGFQLRLRNLQQRHLNIDQLADAQGHSSVQPLDEMELEWESIDRARSGKTILSGRIKKLEGMVIAEEASIGRAMEQLRQLSIELDFMTTEIFGKDDYEDILQANLDKSLWDPRHKKPSEAHGVKGGFEFESAFAESQWLDVIEATNRTALKRMEESEKELSFRHDKIQQSFYQIFRDESYP